METSLPTYDAFRQMWLDETGIHAGLTSVVKGRQFAAHLLSQWLDLDLDHLDPDTTFFCDGPGDGGLDFAYLARSDDDGGDTWYVVQSKYGSAYGGPDTLVTEARKLLSTLVGLNAPTSEAARSVVDRLGVFRKNADATDRLVYVVATTDALNDDDRTVLDSQVLGMGRQSLGPLFEVAAVSLHTLFLRQEETTLHREPDVRVALRAQTVPSGQHLRLGVATLPDLYAFLKAYRDARGGDLSVLYEKNVRQYLGQGRVANKAMKHTLLTAPEQFGLFNNGITLVASEVEASEESLTLGDPYVVNGCQTTRTIFDVLHSQLEAGGSGSDPAWETWRQRLEGGVVVLKVVQVEASDRNTMSEITRYTNSQSAVQGRDFHALSDLFQGWAQKMEEAYSVFLEVQRGAQTARHAWEKQHPNEPAFRAYANAFDLLKVYAAGLMKEAGTAFGSNKAFEPEGPLFKRMVEGNGVGAADLYAALLLQQHAERIGFGRSTEAPSRRQTRFLFYTITVMLLESVLRLKGDATPAPATITGAILGLGQHPDAFHLLTAQATSILEDYFVQGEEHTIWNEPELKRRNGDVNGFLKWDRLAKSSEDTPELFQVFNTMRGVMKHQKMNEHIAEALPPFETEPA